ncbi:hypothetical protein P7K49_032796 [Saguinus oedipus]|uniref:Uncharacterized protein n=1 Tax=Saguinus oedipus TaxID=9490 RepID=A0ABQ9TQF3_SAGOE|nr:hypothetical protein P7K49_032796 [Saguinus oedipus]
MKGTSQYYPSYSSSSRRRAADGGLGEQGLAGAAGASEREPAEGGGWSPVSRGHGRRWTPYVSDPGWTPGTWVLGGMDGDGLAQCSPWSPLPVAPAHEAATDYCGQACNSFRTT